MTSILRYQFLCLLLLCSLLLVPGVDALEASSGLAETAESSKPEASQAEGLSSAALWGGRRNVLHPFLGVQGYWTNNLFNYWDLDEADEDWVTVTSPGIWVALPGNRQPLLHMPTLNTAPGGLQVNRFKTGGQRRLQAYALYRVDFEEHQNFPEEDLVSQRGEGLLEYRLRNGLALELTGVFQKEREPYATGDSLDQDQFRSGLINLLATYEFSPRVAVRADFTDYRLRYDAERNIFRDRDDQVFGGYLFWKLWPKTAAFLEYERVDITYDRDVRRNSSQDRYFAGLRWKISSKSRGRVKVGAGRKDYASGLTVSRDTLEAEAQFDYSISPKTGISLLFTRMVHESDLRSAQDMLSHRGQLGYRQQLSPKLSGSVRISARENSYRGDNRKDVYSGGEVFFGYALFDWLDLGTGFSYEERDSNDDLFDYHTSKVFLNLTAAF